MTDEMIIKLKKHFYESVKFENELVIANQNISTNTKDFILGHAQKIVQIGNETFAMMKEFISNNSK